MLPSSRLILAAVLLVTVSCGDKEESKKRADPEKEKAALEATASEIEKDLPASLKGKISFEAATVGNGDGVVVRPKGWKEAFEGNYSAPDELGFGTSFWVSTNCDGMCEKKDWAAVSDKVDFAQYKDEKKFKVQKDEKSDEGRVLIASDEDDTWIVVARWKKDAPRYVACRVKLAKEAKEAAAAFERACGTLKQL
ncbi:MAG: hypothetical protein HOW73_32830 [Polyangiaceae bacterium]|nr:hypothetical protein [Polyangiaceae bacterium]